MNHFEVRDQLRVIARLVQLTISGDEGRLHTSCPGDDVGIRMFCVSKSPLFEVSLFVEASL